MLILALASMLGAWKGDIDLRRLALALGVAGIPLVLIMLQPDLGTALVFIAITVVMFLIGGVRGRYLAVLALVGIIGITGILTSNVLGQYQKDRLTVFLDSNAKLEGPAYNVNQSQAAIANGGVTGSGPLRGAPDPAALRPRAADRLHLHRPGRAARLRRGRHAARVVRDHRAGASGAPRSWRATCWAP